MSTGRRRTVLAAVVAVTVLACARPAGAHSELLESDPADGATVDDGLDSITLRFTPLSQNPEPSVILTLTPDEGGSADPVATSYSGSDIEFVNQATIEIAVEPLDVGRVDLEWSIVGEDGDLTNGDLSFTVVAGSGDGPFGVWLLWAFVIGVPAVVFLRPRRRRKT